MDLPTWTKALSSSPSMLASSRRHSSLSRQFLIASRSLAMRASRVSSVPGAVRAGAFAHGRSLAATERSELTDMVV